MNVYIEDTVCLCDVHSVSSFSEQVVTRRGSFLVNYIYILEIAYFPVEIETIADDELRRDGERHIIGYETGLGAFGLMQERYEAY